jgi:hypothetical protein
MKALICFTLAVVGIMLGIYVGGYLMFFSGLMFIIDLFLHGIAGITAFMIAVAIIKIIFAAGVGWMFVTAFFSLAAFIDELL